MVWNTWRNINSFISLTMNHVGLNRLIVVINIINYLALIVSRVSNGDHWISPVIDLILTWCIGSIVTLSNVASVTADCWNNFGLK